MQKAESTRLKTRQDPQQPVARTSGCPLRQRWQPPSQLPRRTSCQSGPAGAMAQAACTNQAQGDTSNARGQRRTSHRYTTPPRAPPCRPCSISSFPAPQVATRTPRARPPPREDAAAGTSAAPAAPCHPSPAARGASRPRPSRGRNHCGGAGARESQCRRGRRAAGVSYFYGFVVYLSFRAHERTFFPPRLVGPRQIATRRGQDVALWKISKLNSVPVHLPAPSRYTGMRRGRTGAIGAQFNGLGRDNDAVGSPRRVMAAKRRHALPHCVYSARALPRSVARAYARRVVARRARAGGGFGRILRGRRVAAAMAV